MKKFILVVSVGLTLAGVPAHAGLEEKAWSGLSDDFQLGYLWGMLDTTVTKVWDHKPKEKRELYWYWKESVEKHVAEYIKTKEISPFQLQTMLNDFMRQHPPEPGDTIDEITTQLIKRTCLPSP